MTTLPQVQADAAAVLAYLNSLTPTPPPPTLVIPPIPTTPPAGYSKIVNSQSFAGLKACPPGWFLYGPSQPPGPPTAWWSPSLVHFLPNYVSLVAQGPMLLPTKSQGYEAGGIGCNGFAQTFGRWDFCVRISANAAAMSAIALLWPDSDPRPWPQAGETDGLETWGNLTGWNLTEHYLLGSNQNPQKAIVQPAGFDPTQFFQMSIIREAGKSTVLLNGSQAAQIIDPNIPATPRNLDFQYQYTAASVGTQVPVIPCPYDIAWAVAYS